MMGHRIFLFTYGVSTYTHTDEVLVRTIASAVLGLRMPKRSALHCACADCCSMMCMSGWVSKIFVHQALQNLESLPSLWHFSIYRRDIQERKKVNF